MKQITFLSTFLRTILSHLFRFEYFFEHFFEQYPLEPFIEYFFEHFFEQCPLEHFFEYFFELIFEAQRPMKPLCPKNILLKIFQTLRSMIVVTLILKVLKSGNQNQTGPKLTNYCFVLQQIVLGYSAF